MEDDEDDENHHATAYFPAVHPARFRASLLEAADDGGTGALSSIKKNIPYPAEGTTTNRDIERVVNMARQACAHALARGLIAHDDTDVSKLIGFVVNKMHLRYNPALLQKSTRGKDRT